MVGLMRDGLIPAPDSHKGAIRGDEAFGARIVSRDVPRSMQSGRPSLCRLHIENAGERGWLPHHRDHQARVALGVFVNGRRTQILEVTQDVHRGGRWHFLFEVTPPDNGPSFRLRLRLLGEHQNFSERLGPLLVSEDIVIERTPGSRPTLRSLLRRYLIVAAGSRAARIFRQHECSEKRSSDISD
jgi:hypothetical protein